jgi:hypothetical protein
LVALVVGGVEIGSTLLSITHRHFTYRKGMWLIEEITTNQMDKNSNHEVGVYAI